MKNNESEQSTKQGQRILLAEDYEVNQKIGQMFLQKAGYQVDIAENGQQAVEIFQQNDYDLILMDIQMPIMDGYQAIEAIRKLEAGRRKAEGGRGNKKEKKSDSNTAFNNPHSEIRSLHSEVRIPTSDSKEVPIIAMTGNTTKEELDTENSLRINEYIRKPAQWDQVLLVVQKWIDAEFGRTMQTPQQAVSHAPDISKRESSSPLDMDKVIEEFMGQKEILFEILEEFVNRAGDQVENIRRAVDCSDYGVIFAEAHAIKGGAANLAAYPLAEVAADLEEAAEVQHTDQTLILAEKLEIEFNQLEKFLRPKLRKE